MKRIVIEARRNTMLTASATSPRVPSVLSRAERMLIERRSVMTTMPPMNVVNDASRAFAVWWSTIGVSARPPPRKPLREP